MPKQLRDHLGLRPGEVEVIADGAELRVEPLTDDTLEENGGLGDFGNLAAVRKSG